MNELLILVLTVVLVWLSILLLRKTRRKAGKTTQRGEFSGKAYVIDADDLVVKGCRVRLDGIDAPEHRQLAQKNGRWYNQGKWVKRKLIKAVGGQYVLVKVNGYDKYGRIIGRVFCEGKDVGEWMVRNGLAIAAYSDEYSGCERVARQERRGIWGDDVSYNPKYWKHDKRVKLY